MAYTNDMDVNIAQKVFFTTCGEVVGSHQKLKKVGLNGWTHAPHLARSQRRMESAHEATLPEWVVSRKAWRPYKTPGPGAVHSGLWHSHETLG